MSGRGTRGDPRHLPGSVIDDDPVPGRPSLNAQVARAALVAAAAVAVNLAIYGLARAAGVSLIVPAPGSDEPTRLPLGAVVAATVAGVAFGALLLAGLRRYAPDRAAPAFVVAVAVFAVLSLLSGPFSLDTSADNKLVMGSMHVTTAVLTVAGLLWRAPAGWRSDGP